MEGFLILQKQTTIESIVNNQVPIQVKISSELLNINDFESRWKFIHDCIYKEFQKIWEERLKVY